MRTKYEEGTKEGTKEGAEESRRLVSGVEEDRPPDEGRFCTEIETEAVPCTFGGVEENAVWLKAHGTLTSWEARRVSLVGTVGDVWE